MTIIAKWCTEDYYYFYTSWNILSCSAYIHTLLCTCTKPICTRRSQHVTLIMAILLVQMACITPIHTTYVIDRFLTTNSLRNEWSIQSLQVCIYTCFAVSLLPIYKGYSIQTWSKKLRLIHIYTCFAVHFPTAP